MEISTIRAFQKTLTSFQFPDSKSFPEEFAIKRFLKKMEVPDASRAKERAQLCWETFLACDESLPKVLKPTGKWYIVRERIHKMLANYSVGSFQMTNGSEFFPTRGQNSVESKLAGSVWSVTRGCRDLAISMIRDNHALTRAFKQRYRRAIKKKGLIQKRVDAYIWRRSCLVASDKATRIHNAWIMKADLVFTYVNGSRFSTVRKNNEKDRPINIEALLNVLVQREIGVGLRDLLKKELDVDLLSLATTHKERVSQRVSTIDLANASDSILLELCEFLFPRGFLRLLKESRSEFILGLDGDFHPLRKVSAMGNGFTFELMSFILNTLVRVYDDKGTVFGDDIIIDNGFAKDLIVDLESVGFVVNRDKSFINSDFRESCGAHFHEEYGYLKSFDFEYPNSIGDCVNIFNKCVALSEFQAFSRLASLLKRSIPPALRGGQAPNWSRINAVPSIQLPPYFTCGTGKVVGRQSYSRLFEGYHRGSEKFTTFIGWEFKSKLRSRTVTDLCNRRHWAKYLMYLYSGMRCDDSVQGSGSWQRLSFISDNDGVYRLSSIREALKGLG